MENLTDFHKPQPTSERRRRAQALADAMGPGDPGFDMKKFTDDMWGEK